MNLPRSPSLVRRGQRGAVAIIDAVALLPRPTLAGSATPVPIPAQFGGLASYGPLAASAVLSP